MDELYLANVLFLAVRDCEHLLPVDLVGLGVRRAVALYVVYYYLLFIVSIRDHLRHYVLVHTLAKIFFLLTCRIRFELRMGIITCSGTFGLLECVVCVLLEEVELASHIEFTQRLIIEAACRVPGRIIFLIISVVVECRGAMNFRFCLRITLVIIS